MNTLQGKLKVYIIILSSCYSSILAGQSIFTVDQIFLPNEEFVASDFNDTTGIAITASGRVFYISSIPELEELTDHFSVYSAYNFTDVQVINQDQFFIATEADSLLRYTNGMVEIMGVSKGLDAARINSFSFPYIGTENGEYVYDSSKGKFSEAGIRDKEVRLLSRNHGANKTTITNGFTYCTEVVKNTRVDYYSVSVNISSGFLSIPEHFTNEVVADGILIPNNRYYNGGYDFQSASNFYGSNRGLKHHFGGCNSEVKVLIDNIPVNDMILYGLFTNLNIPRMILTATNSGLYITENIKWDSNYETQLMEEVGNVKVNQLSMTDMHCDLSVWASTENGLIRIKDISSNPSFTGKVMEFKGIVDYCEGESYQESPLSSVYFKYEWIKDGEIIPGANNYYLDITGSGFYQLHYWNCHEDNLIDVARYETFEFVDVEFDYRDDLSICSNQNFKFSLSSITNKDIQWYFNDEPIEGAVNTSYSPKESGGYKFLAKNCNGFEKFSKTVNVTFVSIETPKFQTDLKQQFCSGDTIRLMDTDLEFNTRWIVPGTTSTEFDGKFYYVIFNDNKPSSVIFENNGCEAKSNIQSLLVYPPPPLTIWEDTVTLCEEQQILLRAESTSNNEVIWTDGETGSLRFAREFGMYYAYSLDNRGCRSRLDSIYVKDSRTHIEFEWLDSTIAIQDEILLSLPEGYDYLWQDGQTTNEILVSFDIPGEHVVSVEITNELGCIITEFFTFTVIEPLASRTSKDIKIYPNPAKKDITLFVDMESDYMIYNLSGERITIGKLKSGKNTIDISRFTKGLYLIEFEQQKIKLIKE
ncbi:MAG: T9SS type A sorting domain-containing protein [Cyclobacteriaceae bacterium]